MLKGNVKIEVFNKDGLLKEKIEKDNMITSAIENILFPPFENHFECYNQTKINPLYTYSSIYKDLIGGVFLFNSHREESLDHILPNSEDIISYVGSAGGNFNGTTSKVKGSLNLNESTVLEDGYKYVWDFKTGSAFNLSSLSLTSRNAANIGLDYDTADTSLKGEIIGKYNTKLDGENANTVGIGSTNPLSNIPTTSRSSSGTLCYISEDFKTIVLGTLSSNSYLLTKYTFDDSISVLDNFKNTAGDINTYSNWKKDIIYTISSASGLTLDNLDRVYHKGNYIYSVSCSYSSTDKILNVNFVKIDVETMTIEEEKTISISDIEAFSSLNSYFIRNNKLFINDGTKDNVFIINLNTNTLEKIINYPTRDSDSLFLLEITDDVIGLYKGGSYFYLIDLESEKRLETKLSGTTNTGSAIGMFNIRNAMRLGNSPVFVSKSYNSNSNYISFNIFECFFASIINFDTIVKGETDTLKITYTITNN